MPPNQPAIPARMYKPGQWLDGEPPGNQIGPIVESAQFRPSGGWLFMRYFRGKRVGRFGVYCEANYRPDNESAVAYLSLKRRKDGPGYGTRHVFATIDALARDLPAATEDLIRLARNEDLLRCPECKDRYLVPHLTTMVCEATKGAAYRDIPDAVACRGTSNRIPAVITHE